ncbi:MAG: hypothetical protein MUC43_00275 [Pirellula sp.]|nr:hypothetical protein [Pirellula sp.]
MNSQPEHQESPYTPTYEPSPDQASAPKSRWSMQTLLIASLYLVSVFSFASNVFYYENTSIYFASSVIFAVVGTVWAINDARIRHQAFHPILRMLHLLLCPASLILYLIITRGLRGIAIAAVHTAGIAACSYGAFIAVYYAVYYTGFWNLFDPVFLTP